MSRILGYRDSGICYSREMPFIKALYANQARNIAMKRQNPYVAKTTKAQRLAKIANNPRAFQNRQMVLYRSPQQSQFKRSAGSRVDTGYVDLASASYNCDTTGSIALIATIPQGAGVGQRIGKRAMYKSILCRGILSAGSTGVGGDAAWMIVYDKRPTGALPAITDILTSVNSKAFMNDNNTGRFQIVRRWDDIVIGNSTSATTGREFVNFDQFVSFRAPITFESAGTGAIGDIDMGALYFVSVGGNGAGTTSPTLLVAFRTKFTEQ